jgi:fucose permease
VQRNISLTPVITASTYLGMVSIGAVGGSYGAALEVLRATFGVGDAQLGLLGTAQTVGGLIGNLSSTPLERVFTAGQRLCVGGSLFAFGAVCFALSAQFELAMLALFVMGLGMGLFQINFSKLYSRGFGTRSGAVMTVMSSAFAVGSIAGPVLAAALGSNYRVLPIAFGVLSALLAVMLRPAIETDSPIQSSSRQPARLSFTTWLFGLMVFFYVLAEQGASFWGVTHLESLGVTPDAAALVMSLFWTALLIGRFAGAALSLRFPSRTVMIGSAAGATLCLAASHVPALTSPAYLGAGLCFAAVFPTGLVWLARFNSSSQAITLYFVAGSVGAALGLPLIGWLKNFFGAGAIPTALTVSSGLCLLVICAIGARQPQAQVQNDAATQTRLESVA